MERLVGQANGDQLDAATIAKQLAKIQRQMAALDAAMAEVERVKAAGETVPKHIPLTDPQARVGAFANGRDSAPPAPSPPPSARFSEWTPLWGRGPG